VTGCLPAAILWLGLARCATGSEPVALRVENLTVPPSSGPLMHVLIANRGKARYEGKVDVSVPEGWRLNRTRLRVRLRPGETRRLDFAIERALDNRRNRYRVAVVAEGGGRRVERTQEVVCASAPYFQPRIDGKATEWDDAIPVSFVTRGKRTTIRTYWNHDAFCVLVEVQEEDLSTRRRKPDEKIDAVQLAIARSGTATPSRPRARAERHEFLPVASFSWLRRSRCYRLLGPGARLVTATQERDLDGLECRDVALAVRCRKDVTTYECAIPFRLMPEIKPSEGREFFFSVLVHDPDGTGLREWGEAAGLWPWQRNPLAWCRWRGDSRGQAPPFDSRTEWGLCSSRH